MKPEHWFTKDQSYNA